MNKRIRNLLSEAGAHDNWNEADWFNLSPETIDKFAELVIKDTMQVVANNIAWNSYLTAVKAVVEHFGVEK